MLGLGRAAHVAHGVGVDPAPFAAGCFKDGAQGGHFAQNGAGKDAKQAGIAPGPQVFRGDGCDFLANGQWGMGWPGERCQADLFSPSALFAGADFFGVAGEGVCQCLGLARTGLFGLPQFGGALGCPDGGLRFGVEGG